MRAAACLALLAGLVSTAAGAVEFRHDGAPPVAPIHNCTCRYKGGDVPLGELRCLQTPDGLRNAQCVLEQNVTSWHPVSDPCPEASLLRTMAENSTARSSSRTRFVELTSPVPAR